ncbi:MAG: putative sulfate exporter family transporter [Candidatus Tectomicrobia bacterium]|uniref:Sulfate exporter family transporter n=1 Tax=Tectimicrobiota bacterium TaxID=2528274 RepID=A0A932GML9_UNCTE|nr:putative sulfate exporter family transporter [Candidatus Tectomicrobia bacterium]
MAEEKKGLSLLKNEDWMGVWLGFLIIALIVLGVQAKMPSFKWTTDGEFMSMVSENTPAVETLVKSAGEKGEADLLVASTTLRTAMGGQDRKAIGDAAKTLGAAKVQDAALKKKAGAISKDVSGAAGQLVGKVFSSGNILWSIYIGLGFLILATIGNALMGRKVGAFLLGFPVIYILAWLSMFIAGNFTVSYWGLEYVLWALIIGLFISNVLGVPEWLKEAIRTEYYIKTGLVILGAGILFFEILQAGAYGIIQAILVVSVIWYTCFWLAKKLRVDDEFAAILATGVSICGVSAAIAACGAIQGDKKKLSYTTSIILVCAVPMMVLMPWIVRVLGIPDVVGGAWLGGTLDTSGSVVAAGSLVSEAAMKVGVIVKFSQNVLIGVAAFILAVWWAFKTGAQTGERPSAGVIWERFPKFVLGFLVASIVFSFFLPATTVSATKGVLGGLRTVWFALAFTCIGLETRFGQLASMEGGRPAVAFLGAQGFNIIWTLILAYLLFGGTLFPMPVIK